MNEQNRKRIGLLGSTGSVGRQALDVVRSHAAHFEVELLTANNNAELLIEQATEFKPDCVVIGNEAHYNRVQAALSPAGIKVFAGADAITQLMEVKKPELLLTAMVGFAGLQPTLAAVKAGIHIALANKETLVVAGDLIMRTAAETGARILPVDSEHSAIFQCLQGEARNPVEKIILTASGGPFRGKNREYLEKVSREETLRHPNWNMGPKITVDSATLMNKGLEMIEAKWLFGLQPRQIEVVVHPQSVIHSMVQFRDGSIKAQMGLPDMKLPIQYALAYPQRLPSDLERFSFRDFPTLTFEPPDTATFNALDLARLAMERGGNMPCVLNAANEAAVNAFLDDRIPFLRISEIIGQCMNEATFAENPGLDDFTQTHSEVWRRAEELISHKKIDKFAN